MGFYSKYCASRAKSVKQKWSYPDPTGVDEPLKIALEQRAGATDAEVCALIRQQVGGETKAKQSEGVTETGGEGRNAYTYENEILARTIEERPALLKAVEENRLDSFLEGLELAALKEQEKNAEAKVAAARAAEEKAKLAAEEAAAEEKAAADKEAKKQAAAAKKADKDRLQREAAMAAAAPSEPQVNGQPV